jgi:hypothetical protein
MTFNYTKLTYYAVGGIANLCFWGFVVGSFGRLSVHADAVGATLATLFGAYAGGQAYRRRHRENGPK